MSKGRWKPESRARLVERRGWTADDYQQLRIMVERGCAWPDIADGCGQTEESCKRIARMLNILPEREARPVPPKPVPMNAADRDRSYVAALLASGGFCVAVVVGGVTVHVYPRAS